MKKKKKNRGSGARSASQTAHAVCTRAKLTFPMGPASSPPSREVPSNSLLHFTLPEYAGTAVAALNTRAV